MYSKVVSAVELGVNSTSLPAPPDQGKNIQSPPYNLPISTAANKMLTNLLPSPLALMFLM